MNLVQPTPHEAAVIEELLGAKRPVTFETAAQALGLTVCEAARRFPASVVAFTEGDPAEEFPDLWAALREWEKATLFIVHEGHVFEIEGRLSPGKIGGGYYNILSKDAVIGGHLNYREAGAVCFSELPFMGRESLSVQFFTRAGNLAFAVYAGRENHRIIDSVREAFRTMKARFAAPARFEKARNEAQTSDVAAEKPAD